MTGFELTVRAHAQKKPELGILPDFTRFFANHLRHVLYSGGVPKCVIWHADSILGGQIFNRNFLHYKVSLGLRKAMFEPQ